MSKETDADKLYSGAWASGFADAASKQGQDLRDNPRSIIPPLVGRGQRPETSGRDVLLSALMGLKGSMAASQQAAQLGDPVLASLAAIGGAAGQPGPDAIAAQRQALEFENAPIGQVSPALAQEYGLDPSTPMSALKNIVPLLQRQNSMEQQFDLALRKMQAALDDKRLRDADRDTARSEKAAEKDEKRRREDAELQVPGFALNGTIRPTPVEAKELRTGIGAVQDFNAGVDRLKELIKEHGSSIFVGKDSGEAKTLASNLKLTLKEVQKLGVLSASDIAFLEAQVFDPTQAQSVFTTKGTALRMLETIQQRSRDGLASSLKAKGYAPASSGGGQKIGRFIVTVD